MKILAILVGATMLLGIAAHEHNNADRFSELQAIQRARPTSAPHSTPVITLRTGAPTRVPATATPIPTIAPTPETPLAPTGARGTTGDALTGVTLFRFSAVDTDGLAPKGEAFHDPCMEDAINTFAGCVHIDAFSDPLPVADPTWPIECARVTDTVRERIAHVAPVEALASVGDLNDRFCEADPALTFAETCATFGEALARVYQALESSPVDIDVYDALGELALICAEVWYDDARNNRGAWATGDPE